MTFRWDDYVMARGPELGHLVRAARGGQEVTIFAGVGFDPRALLGWRMLRDVVPASRLNFVRIGLPAGRPGTSLDGLARQNTEALEADLSQMGRSATTLAPPATGDYKAAGISVLRTLQRDDLIPRDGVIVVDVSSLPSSVYFPVIAGILRSSDEGRFNGELIVMTAENAAMDDLILEEGVSDPGPIHGFGYGFTYETRTEATLVWAPLLGGGQGPQLDAIQQFLGPEEICPLLPFPSIDARRSDDLLVEYRVMLFQQWEVETRNFIYAAEMNPFDAYRALTRLSDRYTRHMGRLGDIVVTTSTHSSKLLSLGCLMAAYDRDITVMTCGNTDYLIRDQTALLDAAKDSVLTGIWMAGAPYQ